MHGEDEYDKLVEELEQETPPRAWGRRYAIVLCGYVGGNTPTCMGKTWHWPAVFSIYEKHPHVHGEDLGIYWALRILWTFLMVE